MLAASNIPIIVAAVITIVGGLPLSDRHDDVGTRTCKHHYLSVWDTPHPVSLDSRTKRSISKRSTDELRQLRIKVFYHESVEDLDETKKSIVKDQVVPAAVGHWEKVLKVRKYTV